MKNGLLKSFSLILALSIILSSISLVVIASDVSKLEAMGGSVELDLTNEGTVSVSVVAKEELTFYGIEGSWDVTEQGETNYFTLTGITSDCIVFDNTEENFADVDTGDIIWVDESFTALATPASTKILTATYKVAAGTPDGDYTVRFTSSVFTGATGDPDETETVFEATIKVTHKCKVEEQTGKKPECEVDGWNAYYKCSCGKCYTDADATTLIPDLEAWKLADGKVPATDHKWAVEAYIDNGNGTHTATYTCDNNAEHTRSDDPAAHVYVEGLCEKCGAVDPLAGFMKGDVNVDGEIDANDLTALARHIAGIEILTNPVALDNADIDSNNDISAEDLTKLARHIAGIELIG